MISPEKILQLYRRGKTQEEISQILDCSRITIQRIISRQLTLMDRKYHYYARKNQEGWLWFVLHCNGEKISKISGKVGLTPQAIHQAIDKMNPSTLKESA